MRCAASLQPPSASAAALAPGFRFHPTDEELVSYYLKRKVAGRPFRVDAISEIDLYKVEPWDLAGMSRIKSRDSEWYFFSALDKKYANRSRTNRATGSGYWKTTGKDRAVCSGGRTVGMKKTLVFHIGRAPKGERTNWVMHEYRLEDEELGRAGIPQDAFVVCRIFQKRGPGPQNGAQYGAPFVEEEWEEDELPIPKEEDDRDAFNVLGNSMPAEIDDYEQMQDMGVQDENTALLVEPDQQDDLNDLFVPDSLLKICEDEAFSNGKDGNIEVPGQQSDQNLKGLCIVGDAADQNQCLTALNDEFLELNDFEYPVDTNSHEGVVCPGAMHNDTNFSNGEISSQQEFHNTEKGFSSTDNENNDPSELLLPSPAFQNDCFVELSDLLGPEPGHYASDEADGNGMPFFDAPSNYLDADHGLSSDMNNFMDSTIASSSEPDLVDELIAYFDATENMQSSDLDVKIDTSNQSNLTLVNGHNVQEYRTPPQAADMDGGNSSLPVPPNADIRGESDMQYDNNSWDKAFTKRLVRMLGAISSPPAFAAEYPPQQAKSIEQYSAAHSSSSMHVAAGMIEIHGVTMPGAGKSWSMLKNRDTGFLLSYGLTSDETGNLAGYVTMPKMPGGIMAFILRNTFHLLFLSVLFLAASFKIWVCIHGR